MSCHQIEITGTGTDFPEADELVAIPGAYDAKDPGILIHIYPPPDVYIIRESCFWCARLALRMMQLVRKSGRAALKERRRRL
jgi:hypothetical protein